MTGYVDVREPATGKLLFRYDARRGLIEIKQHGVCTVVDLRCYHKCARVRTSQPNVTPGQRPS